MSVEIMYTALYMTLCSFLGLLVLPTFSRPAVYAADAAAVKAGASVEDVIRAAEIIDQMQEDEPSKAKLVEMIFHPIPPVEKRRKRLENPRGAFGAYNANRLALYLSIGSLGLLSRAVHCNCGKPSLWSIYPSD